MAPEKPGKAWKASPARPRGRGNASICAAPYRAVDDWEHVARLAGAEPHQLVARAVNAAALLGLPIEFRVTRRVAYIRWGRRGAYFRIAVASPVSGETFQVGLRMYESDFGVLAEVSPRGVKLLPWRLPDYLAVPGDLVTTHVSDVWKARLRAAWDGLLEPGEPPRSLLEAARDAIAGVEGLLGRWSYSRQTLDYVYGDPGRRVYPLWLSSITGSASLSKVALRELAGKHE